MRFFWEEIWLEASPAPGRGPETDGWKKLLLQWGEEKICMRTNVGINTHEFVQKERTLLAPMRF